ncbi:EI24 domain-containing protein [Agromyces marinus]|uniref:EI24 domain-containing protein n=1 Tax=Agromyces marinus TaxID=1389020 RepID=UPI001F20A7EE|nr:EI24 domain-containing protein [Agromyces marinus]UIP57823.1 Sulfate transporter CysZ [Agromyces marinus]
MLHELFVGARKLARGFAFWRRDPGAMLLGLVPAAIVFALFVWGLVALGFGLPALVEVATPFAGAWPELWRSAFRVVVAVVVFAGAAVLAFVTFTALTLVVGDPFYERIWVAVETDADGVPPGEGSGFWAGVRGAGALVLQGLVSAALVAVVGVVPVVGTVAAAILGAVLTGRLLARELSSRALDARGLSRDARRALLRRHRWRFLGFGVATQLCFLVPFGAVITMPAAVAGATLLARSALDTPGAPREARPGAR